MRTDPPPFEVGPALLEGLYPLGSYTRRFPVSVDAYYENLLDWEHLPHLHPTNFGGVRLLRKGDRWWTALVATARETTPTRETSVVIATDRRTYAVRNPTETVVVRLDVVGPREVETEVSFHSVRKPRNDVARAALFDLYRLQFQRLSEEDQQAMEERQAALDRLAAAESEVAEDQDLGTVDEVRARLPFRTTWRGTRYWVVRRGDGFGVHAADCPHMLGPLPAQDEATCGAEVVCPWHAWRFDVVRGRSADDHGLTLRRPFAVRVVDGRVRVRTEEDQSSRMRP